jgi:hypothetical protein
MISGTSLHLSDIILFASLFITSPVLSGYPLKSTMVMETKANVYNPFLRPGRKYVMDFLKLLTEKLSYL